MRLPKLPTLPAMPQLRAALILGLLIANAIYALPVAKIKDEERNDPAFRQAEIDVWYGWFGPTLGISREKLGDWVRAYLWAQRQTVLTLRAPVRPIFDAFHVSQQWGLFAVVTEAPDRLIIEVRRNGEWETLYRRLDGDRDWHDATLKYRRVRGVWDGVRKEPKGTYKRLTQWIARVIFDEQPDVDRVRVLLEKEHKQLPWVEPDPQLERRAERYHRRGEM
ncbi:MAG: hypothetical protein R3F59_16440 [Myxococcota bacterium]